GVLTSIPEVVLRVDAQGRCLEKLGVAERLRAGADPRITSIRSFLSPEAAQDVLALVRRVLEDGRRRGGRTQNRWKGDERWIEARVARISGLPRRTDGSFLEEEPESALVTLRDVTDEHLGQQRAADAEKMQALQKLTGGVAHDFNNLLTTILGNLEMLRPEVRDSDSVQALQDVVLAASRARELTQRLLAYSERQPLQPRPLHLPSFLRDLAAARADFEGVELPPPEPGGPWTLCVDPDGLRSALVGLVSNARDASARGRPVRICADRRQVMDEPGQVAQSFVCLAVEDEGEGMSPSTLSRACDPFFTTRGVERTGLGLSMVRGFARQSGGYFQLHSTEGTGTSALLLLPLFELPSEESRPFSGPSSIVVVADPDANVRGLVGRYVSRLGYLPMEVDSRHELESLLRRIGNVALVVVGEELAAEAMLGARDQARLRLVAGAGVHRPAPDTLVKPLSPGALRQSLELFLSPRAVTPVPELESPWPVATVTSAWALEPPDLGPIKSDV
ncbi:MAG: ATP-binding protein, partial [Myxococcota bacterium]